ncbi:MAG: hypothetical protein HOI95_04000 [Chromatiales bacterium]|nr:hypothetical protein [Chromatiales bacterium]
MIKHPPRRDHLHPDPFVVDVETRLAAVLATMVERLIGSAIVTRRAKRGAASPMPMRAEHSWRPCETNLAMIPSPMLRPENSNP